MKSSIQTAIPLTHPSTLAAAALLRGVHTAPPTSCRVLEINCGRGANIAPMAFHLDRSTFVGTECSTEALAVATEMRDRLGLENLELIDGPLHELESERLGTFDYVIAHGVLSWVEAPDREHLFRLFGECLRPDGVAYVSSNCAPGWALKSQLRQAMMHRIEGVDSDVEQIGRARELLTLFVESPLRETAYGSLLATHAASILDLHDEQIAEDYLCHVNRPLSFREIIALARSQDLEVLDELAPAAASRDVENQIRQALTARFQDPIEAEELTDLFLCRQFRATLLCHREAAIAEVDPRTLAQEITSVGYFAGPLEPESTRLSLEPDVNETFLTPTGVKVSAHHPLLKAALLELGRAWPRGLTLASIVERSAMLLELRRLIEPGEPISPREIDALGSDLLELQGLSHLELRLFDPPLQSTVSSTPRVTSLTRLEALHGDKVTTPLHHVVTLDRFARRLVGHLDGSRDRAELVKRMIAHHESVDFEAHDSEGNRIDGAMLERAIPELLDRALSALASNGILCYG